MDEKDYLIHYGVPGMKWGVRKERPSSGRSNQRISKSRSSERRKKVAKRVAIGAAVIAGTIGAVYLGKKASVLLADRKVREAISSGMKATSSMGFQSPSKPSSVPAAKPVASKAEPKTPSVPAAKPGASKAEPKLQSAPASKSYTPSLTLNPSTGSIGKDYSSQILSSYKDLSSASARSSIQVGSAQMQSLFDSIGDLNAQMLKR